jgi:6-phosphogluconolactonase
MKPEVNFVMTDPGDGPRHLAFHPNGQIMYVVTELSSSIIAYRVDGETGIPVQFQKVSTLPDGHADVGYAADIHVHPSGRFLYASNRGHNSIAVYAINAEGKLSVIEYVDTKGKIPRSFSLSDDGSMLLVANQNSNSIVLFLVDEETGRLIDLDMQVVVPTPTCIKSYPVH